MKTQKLSILLILLLILSTLNIASYATNDSYAVKITPDKTSIKPGETVSINVKLQDIKIESGEKGIGSYEAILVYDKNVFESISIISAENWDSVMYNAETGKFASVRSDAMCSSETQDIATINLKVKTTAEVDSSTVTIKDIGCSNFEGLITTNDVSTQINILVENSGDSNENEGEGDNNNPNQNEEENDTSSDKNTENDKDSNLNGNNKNDETTSPSQIPQTGETSGIIAIVLVSLIIFGIITYKKYKAYKNI